MPTPSSNDAGPARHRFTRSVSIHTRTPVLATASTARAYCALAVGYRVGVAGGGAGVPGCAEDGRTATPTPTAATAVTAATVRTIVHFFMRSSLRSAAPGRSR